MALNYIETRKFVMAHNLIVGNTPPRLSAEILSKAIEENPPEVAAFGLFGTDINFNNYYPDVKPEDLIPQDSDFVEPVYRALSMTTVNKHWDPVSFEKEGVLKKSMKLLVGQSVYANHDREVGNELGSVSGVSWQESYTSKDGVVIPAGFNAKLKIDGKSNPKIARGMMMTPPSIHSTSVTVAFKWEKSHPELSDDEFMNKRGEVGKDGKLVMKIASDIIAYHEISTVHHGADPFAQKVNDDGEIVNPKYAKTQSSFSVYDFKAINGLFNDIQIISNSQTQINNPKTMNFTEMMAELGLAEKNFADVAAFTAFISGLQTAATSLKAVTDITGDKPAEFITNLQAKAKTEDEIKVLEFVTAEGGIDKVKEFKTNAEKPLADMRAEAVKFYKLSHVGNIDDNIVSNISAADMTAAESFVKLYKKEFEEKVPLKCNDCHSTNIDRSAFVDSEEGTGDNKPKILSMEELGEKIQKPSGVKASSIHQ